MLRCVGGFLGRMKRRPFEELVAALKKSNDVWMAADMNALNATADVLFKVMELSGKCRIVLEYDPDSETVVGYQEELDRISDTQGLLARHGIMTAGE